jgi:hypothetical protein
VASERRGAALHDVAQDAAVGGEHAVAEAIAIRPSRLADDVGDRGHEGGVEELFYRPSIRRSTGSRVTLLSSAVRWV